MTDASRGVTSEDKGRQLRAALDEFYKTLVEEKERSSDRIVVTDIAVRFIPVGTSFEQAEEILRHAGFRVDSHPGSNPSGNRPDKYDVVAAISPFALRFPSKTSIYVNLSPKSPGDYSVVSSIAAAFTISFP